MKIQTIITFTYFILKSMSLRKLYALLVLQNIKVDPQRVINKLNETIIMLKTVKEHPTTYKVIICILLILISVLSILNSNLRCSLLELQRETIERFNDVIKKLRK